MPAIRRHKSSPVTHVGHVGQWKQLADGVGHVAGKRREDRQHSEWTHTSEYLMLQRHLASMPAVRQRPTPAMHVAHTRPAHNISSHYYYYYYYNYRYRYRYRYRYHYHYHYHHYYYYYFSRIVIHLPSATQNSPVCQILFLIIPWTGLHLTSLSSGPSSSLYHLGQFKKSRIDWSIDTTTTSTTMTTGCQAVA